MDVMSLVGWTATAVALLGVWLNNRRRRACFLLWLISNAITVGIHAGAGMWAMAARDGAFFVMAIHGWWLWGPKSGRANGEETEERRAKKGSLHD